MLGPSTVRSRSTRYLKQGTPGKIQKTCKKKIFFFYQNKEKLRKSFEKSYQQQNNFCILYTVKKRILLKIKNLETRSCVLANFIPLPTRKTFLSLKLLILYFQFLFTLHMVRDILVSKEIIRGLYQLKMADITEAQLLYSSVSSGCFICCENFFVLFCVCFSLVRIKLS